MRSARRKGHDGYRKAGGSARRSSGSLREARLPLPPQGRRRCAKRRRSRRRHRLTHTLILGDASSLVRRQLATIGLGDADTPGAAQVSIRILKIYLAANDVLKIPVVVYEARVDQQQPFPDPIATCHDELGRHTERRVRSVCAGIPGRQRATGRHARETMRGPQVSRGCGIDCRGAIRFELRTQRIESACDCSRLRRSGGSSEIRTRDQRIESACETGCGEVVGRPRFELGTSGLSPLAKPTAVNWWVVRDSNSGPAD